MFNHEFPPIGGGGGWVSYYLGKNFATAGHDVHLITSQFRDCAEMEEVDGIQVHRVRALRKSPDVCAVHEMLTYAVSFQHLWVEIRKAVQTGYRSSVFRYSCGGWCLPSPEIQ